MDGVALMALTKQQLGESGHPRIVSVVDTDTFGVRVECEDGSRLYVRVAYVGPADERPPGPSWPRRPGGAG